MEIGLVYRGLDFTRRKKKWIFLLGLIGFSSYGVFKMYHSPSLARKRRRIVKILGSLVSLAEMVSDSSETITVVSRDLKEFLKSDSDEIPRSLRQLSKIVRSEEFSESVTCVSQATTVGILRGYEVKNRCLEVQEVDNTHISDKIMDKLMSSTGTGFVSVIVGSFARNLVLGFYASNDNFDAPFGNSSSTRSSRWLDMLLDDKSKVLVAEFINTFVGTAVAVYLDKTIDVNFYDDVFSGLTNPKHQNSMKDIMVSLCNGMVETLVKTSHQVLTASKSGRVPEFGDSFSVIDHGGTSNFKNKKDLEPEVCTGETNEMNGSIGVQSSGWISSVSSTLAVPGNRKFVLDVTGRVTFETVRSIIEYFLWRILEGLKRSVNTIHHEVVERGFEIVRYFGSKSSVILTLCLMLFLHLVENTRVLLPAYNDG